MLSEVGSKDARTIMAPYVWIEHIQAELRAGAWKVIAEARESGTAGIYRADGEVRSGLIDEIAHAVDCDRMIFEAPLKEQQVWLLEYFGSECSLGNIVAARRALAGDAAAGTALGHGRALRAGRSTIGRAGLSGEGAETHPGPRDRRHGSEARTLGAVVFAGLVLACFAAFLATQRLKHTPTAVQSFEMNSAFHPTRAPAASCRGRVPAALVNATTRIEYLSFKLARADAVTVEIVDAAGDDVATIVRDLPAERYKQLSLCWNGHRGPAQRGRLAPPGEYRLRVILRRQDRSVYSPRSFALRGPRA